MFLMKASRLTLDGMNLQVTADGDVDLSFEETTLLADEVFLDIERRESSAKGRVRLLRGDDLLLCDSINFHWESQTGLVEKGEVFVEDTGFRIYADEMEKTGPDTFTMEQGSFTTCDCDSDSALLPWEISAREAELTVGGYARAKKATFRLFRIPVLYVPAISLPVRLSRETGFLIPWVGRSGINGWGFSLPYFWAIDGSKDATLTLDVMTRRGVKPDLEIRYRPSKKTEGLWNMTAFYDTKLDEARYGIAARHTQVLPRGFYNKLDLNIVSDDLFLMDFPGFVGLPFDLLAVSRGAFGFNQGDFHATLEMRYSDLVVGTVGEEVPYETPEIHADIIRRLVGFPWLSFSLNSSATNYVSEEGEQRIRGQAFPEAYVLLSPFPGVTLQGHGGIREILTSGVIRTSGTGASGPQGISVSSTDHRTLVDTGAELGVRLARGFDYGNFKVVHMLNPRIQYRYVRKLSGDDFPEIMDGLDELERMNRITYSLKTSLWGKKEGILPETDRGMLSEIYLAQSVDLDWEEQSLSGERAFSDIKVLYFLQPKPYLSVTLDFQLDPYSKGALRYLEAGVSVWDRQKRHRLYLGYLNHHPYVVDPSTRVELWDEYVKDYDFDGVDKTIRSRLETRLSAYLSATWDGIYLLEHSGKLENRLAVTYLSRCKCWSIILNFRQTVRPDDFGFSVRFQLAGLGSYF